MVQIAGAPFPDVIEMATQAEQLKVDAVLCLPELYLKPKTEEKLVKYMLEIANNCPSIPLFYYHIPRFTNVDRKCKSVASEFRLENEKKYSRFSVNMPRFIDLAKQQIPNFCGLKYSSGDLEQAVACLKPDVKIFMGANTIWYAALAAGFDSGILSSLNIYPEYSVAIMKSQQKAAQAAQSELNEKIKTVLKKGDWVPNIKRAFNELYPELPMGGVRQPLDE
jgi:N-acetylneuraminate lyase